MGSLLSIDSLRFFNRNILVLQWISPEQRYIAEISGFPVIHEASETKSGAPFPCRYWKRILFMIREFCSSEKAETDLTDCWIPKQFNRPPTFVNQHTTQVKLYVSFRTWRKMSSVIVLSLLFTVIYVRTYLQKQYLFIERYKNSFRDLFSSIRNNLVAENWNSNE